MTIKTTLSLGTASPSAAPQLNRLNQLSFQSALVKDAQRRQMERFHLSVLANRLAAPGDKLRALMDLRSVTIRDIAKKTGLGRKYIQSLVDNSRYPSSDDVRRINAAYQTIVGEDLLL